MEPSANLQGGECGASGGGGVGGLAGGSGMDPWQREMNNWTWAERKLCCRRVESRKKNTHTQKQKKDHGKMKVGQPDSNLSADAVFFSF